MMRIRIEYSYNSLFDGCGFDEMAGIDDMASYAAYGDLIREQLTRYYPDAEIEVEQGNNDTCMVNDWSDDPEVPWVEQILADAYESQLWVRKPALGERRESMMRIECQLLPERGEVVTGGNFLVFEGLCRVAVFAEKEDAELFVAAPEMLKTAEVFLATLDAIQDMGPLTAEGILQSKYAQGLADAIAKVKGGRA